MSRRVTLHSRGPIPHLGTLMVGFLAVWALAVWFIADIPHRRGGVATLVLTLGVYAAMALSLYIAIWRRTISVDQDSLVWKHLSAQAVRGGFFPSTNGSMALMSIESIDRVQSGDVMIKFDDGSHAILDMDEYDKSRAHLFADRLAERVGKTVGSRQVSFDEISSALPDDLKADLERRIRQSKS